MTTKQIVTQKFHSNNLHAKFGHPVEYRMRETANHLNFSVKWELEVCENCSMEKRNQKLQHKVAEESELKLGEMIYLDIISQKKPSYGGSNNWILIKDSDTK